MTTLTLRDNDGDGLVGWPADPGCSGPAAAELRLVCPSGMPIVEVDPAAGPVTLTSPPHRAPLACAPIPFVFEGPEAAAAFTVRVPSQVLVAVGPGALTASIRTQCDGDDLVCVAAMGGRPSISRSIPASTTSW